MIRYYPNIFIQRKHIQKVEKKLGYNKKGNQKIKTTPKIKSKAEMFKTMQQEHRRILIAHYVKKHSLIQASKKFHVTKKKIKKILDFYNSVKHSTKNPYGNHIMFGPGFMPRTIGGDVKQLTSPIQVMAKRYMKYANIYHHDQKKYQQCKQNKIKYLLMNKHLTNKMKKDEKKALLYKAMLQRGLSLSDMTPWIYQMCKHNPNTISYWYPYLMKGYDQSNHFFKVPKTKFWTLPVEVAQYLQTDYTSTNQISRDVFNKLVFDVFNLDKNKTYFIKTGVFSGKYEFQNAHCKEPLQMGEYFHVINNFAMQVGASTSVDLCVREWIPDVEHHPTIYDGMPLRTEFRSFIDFDKNKILGIVPYWNPLVMDSVLQRQGKRNPAILKDYLIYRKNIPFMMKEYNQAVPTLQEQLQKLIPKVALHGKWSLDIMKNGKNYYLIDMSLMKDSALTSLIKKYPLHH